MRKRYRRSTIPPAVVILISLSLLAAAIYTASRLGVTPKKEYGAKDFGIETLHSSIDFNRNGVDDYTDILAGARADAQNHPTYNGAYYSGGYPPDDIGVCTDVVWRAFKQAGYSLRNMVDQDVAARPDAYPDITQRDKNIDFRRVYNLRPFFETYARVLSVDIAEIAQWQAGDIVIFGNDVHIGIVSDKRNKDGQPYIIHNAGQHNREEDYLKTTTVTGHYRFDASKIPQSVLVAWSEEY